MISEETTCPLCQSGARSQPAPNAHTAKIYTGYPCHIFAIWHHDEITCLRNDAERPKWQPYRIRALLQERLLKKLPRPVLQFTAESYAEIPNYVPVYVRELLAEWPDSVPEQLDRCLCNLARMSGCLGAEIEIEPGPGDLVLFTEIRTEQEYLLNALADRGWVTVSRKDAWRKRACLTPSGWARFEEHAQGRSPKHNPVFVAMWFGKDDRKTEMTRLWQEAIGPAVRAAGYKVKRADSEEHNDYIMDRIRGYIRRAPFVVADLTGQNQGVYYEAGLGLDVVHCCPLSEKKEVHFDIDQINRVLYEDVDDLRKKLTPRIVGSIGDGPFLTADDPGT